MKSQPYNNFWQKIHRSARKGNFPLRVMFELTYRCNFKCKHCYVPQSHRKKGELKTKDVFVILDQLRDIGCFYLGFTGGEPFMRKDIMKILWYAKKKGFEIILYSNGSLINKKIAAELQRLRPNKVDITIPAVTERAFERITGAKGSRNRVFNAIDILRKRGVNLGFKSCVLKENQTEIKGIQDFCASLSAQHRLDDILSRKLDGSAAPFKYRGQGTGGRGQGKNIKIAKSLKNCAIETTDYGLRTTDLFKCGVGISQAAITPQGELKMCLMIDKPRYKIIGSTLHAPCSMLHALRSTLHARKAGLKESWDKLRDFVSSIKVDKEYKCYKCEFESNCKWCPARGWLAKRSFTSCDPELYEYYANKGFK